MKGVDLQESALKESVKLDSYLSKVVACAYRDRFLICSPAISRNPTSSSLLYKAASGRKPAGTDKIGRKTCVKLIQYYLKSFVNFLFLLLHFGAFEYSRLRLNRRRIDRNEDLIVVSTFTMIDKIYPAGRFDDPYFGSLYEILKKRGKQFVVLCLVFGDKPWNLRRRVRTYNILAKDDRNFVTEFELMGLREWFDLLRFIFFYPFAAISLAGKKFGEYDHLLREEVVETLDRVQFFSYIRYLVGRKLYMLNDRKLKVISWYENQVIDKLLNRGIRESGRESIIYGCQFFVKFPLFSSLYPLTAELTHDVLPDEMLVSGRCYANENPDLSIKQGISPRYGYVFDVDLDRRGISNRNGMLVLLTYYKNESIQIIKLVEALNKNRASRKITVKLHPNHLLVRSRDYPASWQYTEESEGALFSNSSIVVTGSTSAAMEAAVMGCSVIIIGSNEGLTFNPMPEYGKGKIWDMAFDTVKLAQSIDRLSRYRSENPDKIVEMAGELREMFFTKATEQKYVELFDL